MPALANPTLWRTHPHTTDGYLYIYVPAVVFACSVNQTSFSYPVLQITYDGVTTGAYTDVKVGQVVKISDSAGALKGWARIHTAPTSSILYVGALPIGDISLADDDLIEVLNDYRIMSKVSINAEDASIPLLYKDYTVAFSDQTLYPPPVCNLGPHFADFVDSDGYVYVSFDLTASCYAVASGATITTYTATDLAGGTVTSGSVASGIFTVRYGAGKRWLLITITDSNSKTHTGKLLVVGCEKTGTNAPIPCQVKSLGYQTRGWDAEFEILASNAGETVIPENALAIYFEKESYGGTAGSLNGFSGREQIKFVGWISESGIEIKPLTNDLTIKCLGPLGVLNSQATYGGGVSNDASPANWQELADLTLFRFIHYVLHWHSTMLDVCDLELPSWASATPYYRIGVPEGLMGDTVNELGSHYNALFTCDHQGRFFLRRDWIMMTDADRAGVTTTLALTAHDWELVSITEHNIDSAFAVRGSGVLASATEVVPYLSVAPGKTPGQGGTNEQLNNQLVTGQVDLNVRTGRQYGRKNARYDRLTFNVWPGGMVADPAWGERIQFTLNEDTNKRGIEFSSDNFMLHELQVTHDHTAGVAPERWVMEIQTNGVPGEKLPVPVDRIDDIGYVGLPEWQPIDDSLYDPRPTPSVTFEEAPALYMCHADYVTRTRNHTDASPNWEIVFTVADLEALFSFPQNGGNASLGFRGMVLDPWNPKLAAYIFMHHSYGSRNAWVIYVTNLDGPPGTQVFERVMNDTGSDNQLTYTSMIFASINVDGALIVPSLFWDGGHGAWVRTSKVASMVRHQGLSGFSLAGPGAACGTHMASAGSGIVYLSVYNASSIQVYRSLVMGTDWGSAQAPWLSVAVDCYPTIMHAPYEDNPNDALLYIGVKGDIAQSIVRHNADTSVDNIGPLYSGHYYCPHALHSYVGDRHLMVTIGQIGTGGTDYRLFTTGDGGDTWLDRNTPASAATSILGGLWGWPYDEDVMVTSIDSGADRGIWRCNDLLSASQYGVTWTNFLGDWETVTGATYTTPYNCIPVWVP
jgi:hypothetical protein